MKLISNLSLHLCILEIVNAIGDIADYVRLQNVIAINAMIY